MITKSSVILALIMALLTSCSYEAVKSPEFNVDVSLSQEAQGKITQLNETIKVIAYFDGDGIAIPGIKTAPHRDVIWVMKKSRLN